MAIEIPRFLQTKRYPAIELRRAFQGAPIQAGVLVATDLKVTQRGAGANMSVDVAAGDAWVKGSFTARQGMYHVYNDATANVAIATNSSGNPRLDQIVLRVHDTINGGSAQDAATLEVVQGTPTAGATLDNRSGAAALPTSSLRIADVLVADGAASITNSNIRDRRPWGRGAYTWLQPAPGTDFTTTSTTLVPITATSLSRRVELAGVPTRATLRGRGISNSDAGMLMFAFASGDGTTLIDASGANGVAGVQVAGVNAETLINVSWDFIPTAGSHLIRPYWRTSTGTATIYNQTNIPLRLIVEEFVRQSASND